MLELFNHALDIMSAILILVYVIIPLISKLLDLIEWIIRKVTGKEIDNPEEDKQKAILEDSKAWMQLPRSQR